MPTSTTMHHHIRRAPCQHRHAPTPGNSYQPPLLFYFIKHRSTYLPTILDSAPERSPPSSHQTMSLIHTSERLFPSITITTYAALGLFCPLQFSCSGSSSTGVTCSINNTARLRVITFRITIPAKALAQLANRQRALSNAPNSKPSVSFSSEVH